MRSIYFLLLLAVLLLQLNASSNYDYYIFASEWAGSVCDDQNCTEATNIDTKTFNIHGLWPSRFDSTTEPEDCDGPEFSTSKLTKTTKSELIRFWSGLYASGFDFHQHEWEKHGTCWNDDFANKTNLIEDYFQTGLNLGQKYNAYDVLANAEITPGSTYSRKDVLAAFTSAYGKSDSYALSCTGDRLSSIQLCLDKNYQPLSCPDITKFGDNLCRDEIEYPSFDPSEKDYHNHLKMGSSKVRSKKH